MNGDYGIYELEGEVRIEGEELWLDCEEPEVIKVKKTAMRHTAFQIFVVAFVIMALFLMSGCTIQVPNNFELNTFEDCSWEVVDTDFGLQIITGTTWCNDTN